MVIEDLMLPFNYRKYKPIKDKEELIAFDNGNNGNIDLQIRSKENSPGKRTTASLSR